METKFNKLEEFDKSKNPFKIPNNYFHQFNDEIMKKLPLQENDVLSPSVPVVRSNRIKTWLYVAAACIILFFSIQLFSDKFVNPLLPPSSSDMPSVAAHESDKFWSSVQISEEEFFQYLEDQMINDGYYEYIYSGTLN
ncbi:MAG TPA: hypothetical protein DDZ96_09345 [Porphyromonadaceae bacterium]|jgi:p-aminobenzoyl-glutamate transporter AbgT|uniref:hypothetical protein n=1 Tax=Limibacterium fermenti TaxID=3229863 RepID=UPI000E9D74F2|nr:hypothetical protein [Porphyromonadaceae bacterium]HBX20996.1 hypothetical protein [Porphyromonadaceae bacterium]HBX47025.1 hypothetical protein [Porphyromonadaceae bacterium]HCM20989.1 hypothetical protein [Porphyromonadaceae bacterium]